MVKIKNNIEKDNNINLNIINDSNEEYCKVLWLRDNTFAIDFKGYGISIQIENLLNRGKIKEYIKVKYESEIGKEDFKIFPIYE